MGPVAHRGPRDITRGDPLAVRPPKPIRVENTVKSKTHLMHLNQEAPRSQPPSLCWEHCGRPARGDPCLSPSCLLSSQTQETPAGALQEQGAAETQTRGPQTLGAATRPVDVGPWARVTDGSQRVLARHQPGKGRSSKCGSHGRVPLTPSSRRTIGNRPHSVFS